MRVAAQRFRAERELQPTPHSLPLRDHQKSGTVGPVLIAEGRSDVADVLNRDAVILGPVVARQIDSLEAGAFRLPEGDPTRTLFLLRVAIARGRDDEFAVAELTEHCRKFADRMTNFEPFWIHALLAFVWLREFAIVEEWMCLRFGVQVHVALDEFLSPTACIGGCIGQREGSCRASSSGGHVQALAGRIALSPRNCTVAAAQTLYR